MDSGEFSEPARSSLWTRLRHRLALAWRVFAVHPTMPATAFWRIFEAEVILRGLRGQGRGLDVGCGDGSFASVLFPAAPDIRWVGLEQDEVDAALARRSGQYEAVHTISAESMPFEDASFDLVFSNCVLEHIEGLDAVIAHVGRILEPGGRFLFTVPNEGFYDALCIPRVLECLGPKAARRRYVDDLEERLEIVNLLDIEEWAKRLERNGMRIEEDIPYATRLAASLWELVATATGGVAYWVAKGRITPRKIQQSAGLAKPDRRLFGAICYALLLPLLVLAGVQKNVPPYAGRLIVAVREGMGR
jgi:SAM-dependent methyltransferase